MSTKPRKRRPDTKAALQRRVRQWRMTADESNRNAVQAASLVAQLQAELQACRQRIEQTTAAYRDAVGAPPNPLDFTAPDHHDHGMRVKDLEWRTKKDQETIEALRVAYNKEETARRQLEDQQAGFVAQIQDLQTAAQANEETIEALRQERDGRLDGLHSEIERLRGALQTAAIESELFRHRMVEYYRDRRSLAAKVRFLAMKLGNQNLVDEMDAIRD